MKFLSYKRKVISLVLIFFILINFFIPWSNHLKIANAQETDITSVLLDFNPSMTVHHSSLPILYMLDNANKRIIAHNYETQIKKVLQLDLYPGDMTIKGDELFVALTSKQLGYTENSGSIAIVDVNTFDTSEPSIKEQLSINFLPKKIRIDKNGNIIALSTDLYGRLYNVDRSTGEELSGIPVYSKKYLEISDYSGRAYYSGSGMKLFVASARTNNGGLYQSVKISEDTVTPQGKIFITKDGKYLITENGKAYNTSESDFVDLVSRNDLQNNSKLIEDIAVDIDNSFLYLASGNEIRAYDYNTFSYVDIYNTSYNIMNIFFNNNKLIAVTKDGNSVYIESLDITSEVKGPILVNSTIENMSMNIKSPEEIKLDFDKDIEILDSNKIKLVQVSSQENVNVNVSVSNNSLTISIMDELKDMNEYVLQVNKGSISDKSGTSLSYDINTNFSTSVKDEEVPKEVRYINECEIISSNNVIDGDVLIAKDASLLVDKDTTLNVSGDIIVYGKLINAGNIIVGGDILVGSINTKADIDRDSKNAVFYKDSASTTVGNVVNTYPSAILRLYQSEVSVSNSIIEVQALIAPGTELEVPYPLSINYDQVDPSGTLTIKNLKPGENNIIIDSVDVLGNRKSISFSVNNDVTPLKIEEVYPDSRKSTNMPINPYYVIKFDKPIVPMDTIFSLIKFTDKTTNTNYDSSKFEIIEDENGQKNMLVLSFNVDLDYSHEYTLKIPYYAFQSSDSSNASMTKDYVINFTTGKEITRIGGNNRYQTSVRISQEGWNSSNVVVLATGDTFPDALSAAPLAAKYNAPILLTNSKKLNSEIVDEIKRLGAKKVYIIGGYGAVTKDVESILASINVASQRIQGSNRYDTSVEIAKELGNMDTCVIATGNNFPDALSIAPFAAYNQNPILLINNSKVPDSVRNYINDNNIQHTLVIGGTGVISESTKNTLPDAVRLAGKNRYETNFEIISTMGANTSYVYLATGLNFPDALAGAPLAAYMYSPIILVDKNMDKGTLDNWRYNMDLLKMKYILGGIGAVPQKAVDQIFKYEVEPPL